MEAFNNKGLLIAPYLVLTAQMTIEVVGHSDAKDHVGSITGLIFCVATLVALFRGKPPMLVGVVCAINAMLALFGTYVVGRFFFINGSNAGTVQEMLGRSYFVIFVPLMVIWHFIAIKRAHLEPRRGSGI